MKYDCTKTLDYWHEYKRICHVYMDTTDAYECNDNCPLRHKGCEEPTTESIAIVQKWSDEHSEPIKLTRKEHDFLTSFVGLGLNIERRASDRLYVVQHSAVDVNAILIDPDSFSFIPVGEVWYFSKLLNLEVEE